LLRREVDSLLRTKAGNEWEIAGHKQTIEGMCADLTHFKQYFADTKEQLSATQKVLRKAETDNARLSADCEQLRKTSRSGNRR
jgi:septal ring factor EnvC (AmiA/AmiB activator)